MSAWLAGNRGDQRLLIELLDEAGRYFGKVATHVHCNPFLHHATELLTLHGLHDQNLTLMVRLARSVGADTGLRPVVAVAVALAGPSGRYGGFGGVGTLGAGYDWVGV